MDLLIDLEADNTPSAKRFFLVVAFLGVVLLGTTAVMNITVDPTGEYQSGWLPPLSDESRDLKIVRLRELPKDTQTLVFGSSRCMRVIPSELEQYGLGKGYNVSVSAAGIRDHHAFLTFALDDAKLPIKDIVLGLDLESFSPSRGPDRQLLGSPQLLEAIPEKHRPHRPAMAKIFSSLSADKARMSLRALRYEFLTGWDARKVTTRDDGVRLYDDKDAKIAAGTFDLKGEVSQTTNRYRSVYANFEKLDQSDLDALYAFFDRCDSAGIRVHTFLTPLHPDLLAVLERDTKIAPRRAEFVALMEAEASKRGYRFYDGTELASFGGDPNQYYDGSHAFSENMELVMAKLFGQD